MIAYGCNKENSRFGKFLSDSDEYMLDYLEKIIRSSWEKQKADGKDKMPGVDTARAYHGAFPAQHAVPHHGYHILFLASLQGQNDFPHAHPRKPVGRACGSAGAASHAFIYVRLHVVQLFELHGVDIVEVDGRTRRYFESEIHYCMVLL